MNKKFSTLVAGLLLAGGVLSVNAENLQSLAGNGKYYKISRVAYHNKTSGWTLDAAAELNKYFIQQELDEDAVLTSDPVATASLWKVVEVSSTSVQLQNLEGQTLTVDSKDVFFTGYSDITTGNKGNRLYSDAANKMMVGNGGQVTGSTTDWEMLLNDKTDATSTNYGNAYETTATSLEEVTDWSADIESGKTYYLRNASNRVNNVIYKMTYDSTRETWSFTQNSSSELVDAEGVYDFVKVPVNDDAIFATVTGDKFLTTVNGEFALADDVEDASIFAFEATRDVNVSVDQLNFFSQNGFSVTIKGENAAGTSYNVALAGNPFVGHLIPMTYNPAGNGSFTPADDSQTSFYLKNADGKYIVAQKYSGQGSINQQALYKFVTVSEAALIENLQRSRNHQLTDDQIYCGEFSAKVSHAVVDNNPENLKYLENLYVQIYTRTVTATTTTIENFTAIVGRYDFDGTPTLVASGEYGTSLKPIQIKLGSTTLVNVKTFLKKGKFYTVERVTKDGEDNGKMVADGYYAIDWVASYGNELEGQWAVTYDKDSRELTFKNRENQTASYTVDAHAMYVVDGETDTYSIAETINGEPVTNKYVIKTVASHAATDGYITLPQTATKRTYSIAYSSAVFGANAYMTENHAEAEAYHVIGLDMDKANALNFTAVEYSAKAKVERQKDHTDKYTPSDSIYVISEMSYWDAAEEKYDKTKDTLKVVSYSFVNQWNEPLVFEKAKSGYAYQSLVTYEGDDEKTYRYASATAAKAHADADKFTLRKDGTKLNLRPVDLDQDVMYEAQYPYFDKNNNFQKFNNYTDDVKMYVGDAANGILALTHLYERTESDLFVVEETSKAIYRPLEGANENGLDTISIYRDINKNYLLFEKGTTVTADNNKFVNFLGMENIADFTDMAPAMLADTAFVRNDTYCPQYLLVVNPTIVPAGKWCDVHQTADCEHAVPTKGLVSGRYLVSLADTAAAWDVAHKHQAGNPYRNSEGYNKLGFVQATHTGDTLAITREKATAADTLNLANNDFNAAKFAFRYIDTETKSFAIETAGGYLKWMNGYVVIVPEIENADVFNLNEDEDRTPTANEAVAAEVSVVAVKGAIIVKGAAGKVVTVANILGQTIANQVAASDNVTIAAPAGVAVVTVDGEATKVVVK